MNDPTSSADPLHSLRISQARWQAVLETAQDAIISIDDGGTITLFNAAAERIFGYRAEEVIGKDVAMLMPEPYRAEHDGYVRHYQQTGDARAIGRIRNVHALRKNGEVFPIELSVGEARTDSEVFYTAVIRDITVRERAERQVRELEQVAQQRQRLADIGAITAQIVHDLGNPLAAISMQGQLIVRRARRLENESILKAAEQIVSRVRHLDTMVREFLDFTREQRLDLKVLDLPSLLSEVIHLWRPVATGREITIRLEAAADTPSIVADVEKLRRVFDNLIKNAVEAIDSGPGAIVVRVGASTPGKVRVCIEDTGPGIPQDLEVFRLFETTKSFGTGLGLPIAQQIVMAHGGGIEFAAANPHGTIFYVDLPRTGPAGEHDESLTDR